MFRHIFLFELQYRLKSPAFYVYFLIGFLFAFLCFSKGSLPLLPDEHVNSPAMIAFVSAACSMMLMLMSSAIMGTPLYRDIEHQTKAYYLSYPITPAGYFWARFLGSFCIVLLAASALPVGAFAGSETGRLLHWTPVTRYGNDNLWNYLQPFITITLPNLLFTSSLFFGLVAHFRNIKVIYSSGIIVFLGYVTANFLLHSSGNEKLIFLADPFAVNGLRMMRSYTDAATLNASPVKITGLLLYNRVIWSATGLAILSITWMRFSFSRFFSGRMDKHAATSPDHPPRIDHRPAVTVRFDKAYMLGTWYTLVATELRNVARDNFFWIIVLAGGSFLGFLFFDGMHHYGVADFPTTALMLELYNSNFLLFTFIVIVFYAGEIVHREKLTGFYLINDALPAPDKVLNLSKLSALLCLGIFLCVFPMMIAWATQLLKGYDHLNLPLYLTDLFAIALPMQIEFVLLAYTVHTIVNNKFAAHAICITIWVAQTVLNGSGYFTYTLLLYSFTPAYHFSDMDGVGHMLAPVSWFNIYWLLAGVLLLIAATAFYNRGVPSSFRERIRRAGERFDLRVRMLTVCVAVAFIAIAAWNYYNVSYLNEYLTRSESLDRAALMEKTLKRYQRLPLPKITGMQFFTDLFPERQRAASEITMTMENRNSEAIDSLLVDAEGLTKFDLLYNHHPLRYTRPLLFARGKFNFLRPATDSSDFRVYHLPQPLRPGDSAVLTVSSAQWYDGFANSLYAPAFLHNNLFFNGGLPSLGYDAGEEIMKREDREAHQLPPRSDDTPPPGDPAGSNATADNPITDLLTIDATISTSASHSVVAPGILQKQWSANGRNLYHYLQNNPGQYFPFGMISSPYQCLRDSIRRQPQTGINIYYHYPDTANLQRFMQALKDGLVYFTRAFGPYLYQTISLAETSVYAPSIVSMPGVICFNENFGWQADFKNDGALDYCYLSAARELASQWWQFKMTPNANQGSKIISEGAPAYAAWLLVEKKYGSNAISAYMKRELDSYLWSSMHDRKAQPLLRADKSVEWSTKAGLVLFALKDLLGEDTLNDMLREFCNAYAFKTHGPFAGGQELYHFLQQRTPEALQYYLTDSWEKITHYDNRIIDVTAAREGKNNYRVTLTINAAKWYTQDDGSRISAPMDDLIDIGIFEQDTKGPSGETIAHPLYLKKHRFTAGQHTVSIIVPGKPVTAGIDPYFRLIDLSPGNNIKTLSK